MKFKWLNESDNKIISDDKIEIYAPPKTDFFCGGIEECEDGFLPDNLCNAPFYYTELNEDFVFKAKVSHDFKSTYDSSSLMVMKDLNCWAKLCFELTDFGTHAAVSVVTNGASDDANGCNIEGNSLWLQICKVGKSFAFHYSIDGESFYMVRQFTLPVNDKIKVGFLAQCPTGDGGTRIFESFSIVKKTVKNIRVGK